MKSFLCSLSFISIIFVSFIPINAPLHAEKPIRIGATMSKTGALSTQGIAAANGYRLCEIDINNRGGLLGRRVDFIIYDDKSDPERAIVLYEKLITEDKVDAIMGPYGSTHTEAVAPVTEKHRMVHISPLGDFITVVKQMKEHDVNVKMFGTSGAVAEFQQALGEMGEYAYGLSAWEPVLPNPGIDEFVASYRREFDVEPSFHAAGAYGSCQLLVEAVSRAGTLDSEALREELLNLEIQTVFGRYAVDERGYQIANTGLFIQWQDGEKIVVWPEEVATGKPRFPTPVWGER